MKRTVAIILCCGAASVAVAGILAPNLITSYGDSDQTGAFEPPPVSNSIVKEDKLPLAAGLMASLGPQPGLRASVGSRPGPELDLHPETPIAAPMLPTPRPKAAPGASHKNYSLLSEAQISALKDRLKLTAAQQVHWPAVEDALRTVARKVHDNREARPESAEPINPTAAEVRALKAAAAPLLVKLREDQKREVRGLARMIGLDKIAAQI